MVNHTKITIYHLETHDPADLRPSRRAPTVPVQVSRLDVVLPEYSRFLYTAVGGDWYWRDRLTWGYERWQAYLERPEHETWIAYVHGAPAGYTELEKEPNGSVEIAYFGLLPQFIGAGLGGYLLTHAIRRSWQLDARRVWVHTCSLDHPSALANYQARGLRIYKQETKLEVLPDQPLGPWPGAMVVS